MLSELLQALGVSEVVGDYDWLDAHGAPVGATEPDEMATAT
jgi:hypothetical protein